MGAYHARKLWPTTTVYPEVTRCRVATVKLSHRMYLKKRPRIAVVRHTCVYPTTHRVLAGEKQTREKPSPKKHGARAHARTGRQTHPERTKKGLESSLFSHFPPRRFCSRHPPGGADAQSR